MNLETRTRMAGTLVRALGSTWNLQWENRALLEEARRRSPGGNVIYAIWHNALAILAWSHRHQDIQVLVSHHEDGELIARILATLGYGLVRGSSRRGGVEALFGLAKALEAQRDVAVTVDGPLGPRYDVHPGVALLARRTGRPIVPVTATASSRAVLGTWDALRVPYPGSTVRLQHGEPLWIAADRSSDDLEADRLELQRRMHDLTRQEEARHGHRESLRDIQDHRGAWERWSAEEHPPLWLRGLSGVYAAGAWVDRRLRPRLPGKGGRPWVIGVGNLEAGGTGKTPVLLELVQQLCERGLRCAVLTRGHGGTLGERGPVRVAPSESPAGASDETLLMRRHLADHVALVVSPSKSAGYALVAASADVDVLVVDDALQTSGVPIDRHLVLLDATQPLGNGHLLPAGRLREPVSALQRADALLFTRAGPTGMPLHPAWQQRSEACFVARDTPDRLTTVSGAPVDEQRLAGQGVATLCGIGRPQAFEAAVEAMGQRVGFTVRRRVRVADHGALHRRLDKLLERAGALQCSAVLMTAKDACRLGDRKDDEPLLVVEQRLEVEAIDPLVQRLLPPVYSSAKSAISTTDEP